MSGQLQDLLDLTPPQELFARYQIVLAERNQYQTILAERNREQAWMHHWPAEKQLYENYVREMQRTMVSAPAASRL